MDPNTTPKLSPPSPTSGTTPPRSPHRLTPLPTSRSWDDRRSPGGTRRCFGGDLSGSWQVKAIHSISDMHPFLSALLQEASIAEHTALYWTIVLEPHLTPCHTSQTHTPQATPSHRTDLLPAILHHTTPLTPLTISNLQHACLVASNQVLSAALYGR
ncbi:hypothetical protein BV22DRAFT_1133680 [Leucogyrophana mollusca]|uniref:Uncharacterized protein n=1 Tax=Leucogyrophana mollusca TaxID=85980 RepID=A0ACB8B2L6_9AGAM|nr:hypothetical protein BV22DRAFT_1133680 [Leucogyrophana mollusca]